MPDRWLPTDPRQREIHRLLQQLVGGEPAAFFLDACRLMDGDYRLEATTHVVGHLLRELDLVLRAVLRPIVPMDRWPPRDTPDANREQIDAICDALGVGAEDPVRVLWREYARPLHEWAHRYSRAAPRPVDDEFREVWAQGQIVVQRLVRRIEANFTQALPLVDELAGGPPDVGRFRQEFLHSTVALDRFYDRAGIAWLGPLRDEGVFANAPELVYDEDGSVSYARWPQGRFLARIAPEAPAAVIDIGLALETDNPEAHESLLDAALAVDAAEAARLLPRVEQWLETPAQWQLPFKTQELVAYLVNGGELEASMQLLRALINAARVERDRYLGAELVRGATAAMFPAAGLAGLEVLADLLAQAIEGDHEGRNDFSYIWRPYLNGERSRDLRDALVSALRDGADEIVSADPARLAEVLDLLEAREQAIFHRLALDLLVRHRDDELIAAHLTNGSLFDDLNTEREYDALVAAHYATVPDEAKEEILGFIDAGPRRGADDEDYADRWRLQMLARLPELPDKWQQRLAELNDRYGEPEPERLPEVGFVGPSSPRSGEELAAMSDEELVAFLREWEPPEDNWRAPSREGLARTLRQLVVADPQRFANAAPLFADVDPTYAHALVGALREVRTNGRPFPWPPVLEFAVAALDKPRQIDGRDPTGFDGNDPGWTWTWQDIAHLIAAGFEGDEPIPDDERERVWQALSRLAEDEHPRAEDERDEEEHHRPALLAINSVRGCAIDAVVAYVWWLRGDPAEERTMPAEARELLDRHLDPAVEPTAAVHSLYGKWFPYLATADPAWAADNVARIFPADDERLWRAAWQSYLRFNNVWANAFRLLVDQHRRGIEALTDEVEDEPILGDVGTALVNHLMTAYRYGMTDFDDGSGLLELFYERASLVRRAAAIESVGFGLSDSDELTAEQQGRLRALWERRLEAVRESDEENAGEELRGFTWWFASGKFDPAWSLEQLAAIVDAGGRIHPDHLVAEQLAALRDDHLPAVLHALDLLIDAGTRPWFVLGARDEIEAILASGLAANGESSERARDIVNKLVAGGHVDYERLLQR
jgi:hypothetical protein